MKKTKEPKRKNNDPIVNLAKRQKAYDCYLIFFDKYKEDPNVYWSRMVEAAVNEASLNGTITGLISIEALETKIKNAKKLPIYVNDRISTEHPITFKVLALHALNQKTPLSFEEFVSLWLDNLITVFVTSKQNKALMKFQDNFKFGRDCWKEMYKRACINLTTNPNFNKTEIREQYQLPPRKNQSKKASV